MFKISFETSIAGDVTTAESVVIDGVFDGVIDAGPRILVTARATATGTLVADEIVIEGFVTADVYARKLAIADTATVRGRIFHGELTLSRQAYFEGQSRRYPDPREVYEKRTRFAHAGERCVGDHAKS